MDQVSYALGMNIAQNLTNSGLKELNFEAFNKGIRAVMENKTPELRLEEANSILQQFFSELEAKKFQSNIEEGKTFLAENSKRSEINTLASGLQYEIIQKGEGATPTSADKVKCHYHGTLVDGTVFDSSVERGEPAEFPVNGVIQGWVEALQLMPVGSKWRLYVPSNLAYGENGAGGVIGPHATLIFEVELLAIV